MYTNQKLIFNICSFFPILFLLYNLFLLNLNHLEVILLDFESEVKKEEKKRRDTKVNSPFFLEIKASSKPRPSVPFYCFFKLCYFILSFRSVLRFHGDLFIFCSLFVLFLTLNRKLFFPYFYFKILSSSLLIKNECYYFCYYIILYTNTAQILVLNKESISIFF